jgi:hypothetical protein
MYIEQLVLSNIRTFEEAKLDFIHPDPAFRPGDPDDVGRNGLGPRPDLPNVNLLLGDNGSGKSTVLMSIALASLGPVAKLSVLQTVGMIRRGRESGSIGARLCLHPDDVSGEQDGLGKSARGRLASEIKIKQYGDLELHLFQDEHLPVWAPVYKSDNRSFFVVGYGATRRVERAEDVDMGARMKARFGRVQRFQGLFDDRYSLVPLSYWLPRERAATGGRYKEVVDLLDAVLKPARYTFTGEMEKSDYLFERGGNRVPFLLMSDGYRAFIGWVADLLYHLSVVTPPGDQLAETRGIVMVDEIDLHLHPRWQMKVIETVAKALPRLQFIFTSHSPLVAGSLESRNIITLKLSPKANRTVVKRLKESIHGLDADQVLLTDFFGLKTTRAPGKVTQLEELERKARHGDREAARKLILAMSRGMEETE